MRKIFFVCLILFPLGTWAQEVVFPTLKGWESDGKVQVFNKDNLYEHIDGAAEFYLSYGFESLQVASWKIEGSELTVEVYDHGDPLHAYGIYSIERSAKAETSPIGLEGYSDATTLNFVTGKFYVKINSTQPEKVAGFSLKSFATEF